MFDHAPGSTTHSLFSFRFIVDIYHDLRLSESVFINWRDLASCSHDLLYASLVKSKVIFCRAKILHEWKTRFLLQRVKSIQNENIAAKMAKLNKLRWIMRKFKLGVEKARNEREEDEVVATKLEQMKSWLGS